MAIGRREPKVNRASQAPPVFTLLRTAVSMKPTAPPPTLASMPITEGGTSWRATGTATGTGSYIGSGGGAGAGGGTTTTGGAGCGGTTGSSAGGTASGSGAGGGGTSATGFLGTSQVLTFT